MNENIINSLKDNKNGFGSKRLTTLTFVILVVLWHFLLSALITWGKDAKFIELIKYSYYTFLVDMIAILLLLAIITVPQVIELVGAIRNDKPKDNEQNV